MVSRFSDIFVLIAGMMWGVLGIFVTRLNNIGYTPLEISAMRWIVSAIIIMVFTAVCDIKKLKVAVKDLWIFASIGIFSSLSMSTFYFMCMEQTSIAVSDVLMYTSPIWVLIFSVIFFKEKLNAIKLFCIAFVFLGCALVCGIFESENGGFGLKGIIFGLCSGVAYSLYSIIGKVALKKYNQLTITAYSFLFAALGSLFIADIPRVFSFMSKNAFSIKYILLVSLVGTVFPFFLYTLGLKYTLASKAAVLCCIEPVTATAVSVFVAKESIGFSQIVGVGIVLVSIVLLQIGERGAAGKTKD